MKAVEVHDLYFSYRNGRVLNGISLTVEAGEVLGIIGPNSAGKTTLLRLLSRVLIGEAGTISLYGRDLNALTKREVARTVAVVPQEFQVAFPFTVEQVVAMGRYPHARGIGLETAEDRRATEHAMDETVTTHLAAKYLDQLSSGEKQRVVIARALAQQPRLLLLDEPTAHLDLSHQVEILGLLTRLQAERGLTIILVSHDLNAAAAVSDRLVLLKEGTVLTAGLPEEVMQPEILEKAYGCAVWIDTDPGTGKIRILPRL
ncbi:MAG: ABC transporter ATP-binding protein [Candidatus Methylomirabilales bacterium]